MLWKDAALTKNESLHIHNSLKEILKVLEILCLPVAVIVDLTEYPTNLLYIINNSLILCVYTRVCLYTA